MQDRLSRLKTIARDFKRELQVYRAVLNDPRTPRGAKVLLGLAIGYIVMPFDLIPDFIPILGQLDDVVIVPLLIISALKKVPPEIVDECRLAVSDAASSAEP